MKFRSIIACSCLVLFGATQPTSAVPTVKKYKPKYVKPLGYNPRAGRLDHRLKRFVYNENKVINIKGHYGFETHIQFSDKETIKHIALGDSEAWQIKARRNHVFIKPGAENASTNMTILTDLRTYQFDLEAHRNGNKRSRDLTYSIKFIYPQEALAVKMEKWEKKKTEIKEKKDYQLAVFNAKKKEKSFINNTVIVPGRKIIPSQINWDYTRGGSNTLAPVRVFDDGLFTYFQFDERKTIPAIFMVGADKKESLVNFHKKGDYYVVQRIASQFSLRSDNIVSCVFNEKFSNSVNSNIPVKGGAKGTLGMRLQRFLKGS